MWTPITRERHSRRAPLYQVVKRQITDAIMFGKWPAGTVLPNEIALAQMFGVAVGTLRRALLDLTKEGMLSRQRKTGTIFTGCDPQHSLRFFFQYFRLTGETDHCSIRAPGFSEWSAEKPTGMNNPS